MLASALAFGAVVAPVQAENLAAAVHAALPATHDAYVFLHRNPELGKKEFKAHDYIATRLKALGYTDITTAPSAPTAVIAVLDTGKPGPTIALRAEMDARPLPGGVEEPASHNPRSQVPGVMHNCGHDVHAAILLGLAEVLKANRNRFAGKIVLVFQPAEETPGGADDIVADKVLDKLGVQQIYAEHSAPGLPVGTIAIAPGDTLAGSNYFTLTLSGKGSHAAAPYEGNDVALAAMKVAEAISELPARGLDISNRPAVLSITKFVADSGASNVVPSSAQIAGTIRAFEDLSQGPNGAPSIAGLVEDRIQKLSTAYGLKAEFKLRAASPPTRNDPALFAAITPKLAAAFPGKLDTTPGRGMFSEDFAFYTPHYQALYFSLGIAKDGLGQGGVHTVDFTAHPDALIEGLTLMTMLAELGTTGAVGWR